MADPISITVSILALAVSSATAWLTLFRRGTVKMTQPTVIFLGPEIPRSPNEPPSPKIYLRTLLFSTSKRWRVIQSMESGQPGFGIAYPDIKNGHQYRSETRK